MGAKVSREYIVLNDSSMSPPPKNRGSLGAGQAMISCQRHARDNVERDIRTSNFRVSVSTLCDSHTL